MLLFAGLVTWPAANEALKTHVREALVIDVRGVIGPATAAYLEKSIAAAETRAAEVLVMRLDTPGGLDTSMRSIIKAITGSSVPVIGYVAPTGARAASAGTYLLYACQIAAMAPGTNLGAATPVQLGGLSNSEPEPSQPVARDAPSATDEPPGTGADQDRGTASQPSGDAKRRKVINDAAAYIRSLADLHGRNGDWAERAVREGVSLSAESAVKLGVVDLIAPNLDSLLQAVDGRLVRVGETQVMLNTAGAAIVERPPDWKTRLLAVISDPNVAYILMLVGIYGLIYEFANPGVILPGTVGALSLLLALYAFQLLPINYAGLALIALGLALMIGEAFTPSFGALGISGVITFIVGSLILIETDLPGFGLSLPLILGFALVSALLSFFIIGLALKAQRRPVITGAEALRGALGHAVDGFPGEGSVRLRGEIWSARCDHAIAPGAPIRVVGRDGLSTAGRIPCPPFERGPFMFIELYFVPVIVLFGLVIGSLRILREYVRGVIFTLGRFTGIKGPGLVIVIPGIQKMERVDLRVQVMDVPSQDVISRDNVSVKVNAVVYFRVIDPEKAIIQVEEFRVATSQLAQTTLRSVLGQHDLDEMLAEREKLNDDIRLILDAQTDAWGIKVANVEIKHVDLDESMIRAIARQAEAERSRRAKVIHAEGEQQAAEKLMQAARILAQEPQAIQLRFLETLNSIAGDRTSTIVFPVPLDLLGSLLGNRSSRDTL